LEGIYEDDWFTARYASNLQVKQLAMTLSEGSVPSLAEAGPRPARSVYETLGCALNAVVKVDDLRFNQVRAALERVTVIGLTERCDDLYARLARDHGWNTRPVAPVNVGAAPSVSNALRRRIEADNHYDLELYERARERVALEVDS
jgi:hypothetical protein